MIRRRFSADAWMHIYKRRHDGFLIFYSIKDYLVYFTLHSVLSVKYGIKVYGLCFMLDHIHSIVQANNLKQLSLFEHEVSRLFSLAWNEEYGKSGQMFGPFGSAPKYGNKEKRSVFAYVVNNPVERHLCNKPEQFKWNFLHPPLPSDRGNSGEFLYAKDRVNALRHRLRPLTYAVLNNLVKDLDEKETGALVNHIINTYNVIDYDAVVSLYGDYNQLLGAVNSNVGGEYEIRAHFIGFSDKTYASFSASLQRRYPRASVKEILNWGTDKKLEALFYLEKTTYALDRQIAKYLHLRVVESADIDYQLVT